MEEAVAQGSFPPFQSLHGLVDYTSSSSSPFDFPSDCTINMHSVNQCPGLTLSPGSQDSQLRPSQLFDLCLESTDLDYHVPSSEEPDHGGLSYIPGPESGESIACDPLKAISGENNEGSATPQINSSDETIKRVFNEAFPNELDAGAKRRDKGSKSSHKVGSALSLPQSPFSVGFQGKGHAVDPQSDHREDDSRSVCSVDSLFDGNLDFDENELSPPQGPDHNLVVDREAQNGLGNLFAESLQSIEQNAVSEATKERFHLDSDDLAAHSAREFFTQPKKNIEYKSPYVSCWGTIGYVPSAANLHVAHTPEAKQEKDSQVMHLQRMLQKVTAQRDQFLRTFEGPPLEVLTEKSNEQLLRDEVVRLRHLCATRQRHASDSRKEAKIWRDRCSDMAEFYELHQKQAAVTARMGMYPPAYVPGTLPLWSAIPNVNASNLPQNVPNPCRHDGVPMADPSFHQKPSPLVQPPASTQALNQDIPPQTQAAKVVQTIDLTADDEVGLKADMDRPSPLEPGKDPFQTFRQKDYSWLGDRNYMKQGFDAVCLPKPSAPFVGRSSPVVVGPPAVSSVDIARRSEEHDLASTYSEESLAEMLEKELAEGL